MRRTSLLLALAIVLTASLSLADEVKVIDENQIQTEEELSALSTNELEWRLEEANQEIDELETKVDYLKTEEPEGFNYSPGVVETTGFIAAPMPKSDLLDPMPGKKMRERLDRLYIFKQDIEKELDKR